MAIGEQVDENTHKTDHFPGSDKISNNHIDGYIVYSCVNL
jgi:hypothetical protein